MSETDRLAEVRARWAKTTSGPWKVHGVAPGEIGTVAVVPATGGPYIAANFELAISINRSYSQGGHDNAEAIAHAPDDIAVLLAEVERLRRGVRDCGCRDGWLCKGHAEAMAACIGDSDD